MNRIIAVLFVLSLAVAWIILVLAKQSQLAPF